VVGGQVVDGKVVGGQVVGGQVVGGQVVGGQVVGGQVIYEFVKILIIINHKKYNKIGNDVIIQTAVNEASFT